jgi:uncharacterized protein
MSAPAAVPEIRVLDGLATVSASAWDALAGPQPFLRHAFLHGLEEHRCVGPGSGWQPAHLSAWRGERLVGALPLYLKTHSYGEYVFDWSWAEAYARHGFDYYPKLVCAIPFTPVTGPRLLGSDAAARPMLIAAALAATADHSSLHVLFPGGDEARNWERAGCMLRHGLQFHWRNEAYANFDEFLATLAQPKRKKIRHERRRVAEAGVRLVRKRGRELSEADWAFFERCYAHTYRAHRSTPYLNLGFFAHLGAAMPDQVLMVIAEHAGRPIAAALNLYDGERLYGRYWGALEHVPALHFEACYYQAIEFCIEQGIGWIEGGAQGEHKLSRGFLPMQTWSAHKLEHPEFSDAVERYLAREARGVAGYIDELNERAPFKKP